MKKIKYSFGQWLLDNLGDGAIGKYWSDKNEISPFDIGFGSEKRVWIKCDKKGHPDYHVRPGNFIRNNRCPVCSNHQVVKGINDIATTNPEMVKYFVNIEDAYTHTIHSNKKCLVCCVDCGYQKYMTIRDLSYRGFSCNICGDGISYPNKFMANVLVQLGQVFIPEYSFTDNTYRYDFYIEKYNLIIEMHGAQHYRYTGLGSMTLEEIQENDKQKQKFAIGQGIKNYVVIDCSQSIMKFIVNNIGRSDLNTIFTLEDINWVECDKLSRCSLVKRASELWNSGMTSTTQIGSVLCLNITTVRRYLKQGTQLGWCNYSPIKSKPVLCVENNYVFQNADVISQESMRLFNIPMKRENIQRAIRSNGAAYGYHFRYISLSEYNNAFMSGL